MQLLLVTALVIVVLTISAVPSSAYLDEAIQDSPNGQTDDEEIVRDAWALMEHRGNEQLRYYVEFIQRHYQSLSSQTNVSDECHKSILRMLSSAKVGDSWAVKMLDAWGKLPAGFLEGTHSSLGSYDECLDIKIPQNVPLAEPAYCTAKFRPLLPTRPRYHNIVHSIESLANFTTDSADKVISVVAGKAHFFYYTPIRFGCCLPSNCTLRDANQLAHQVGRSLALQGRMVSCETRTQAEQFGQGDSYEWIALLLIATLLLVITIATVADLFCKSARLSPYLLAFSFTKNAHRLLSGETGAVELSCINGIRFWTMAWIIMGHTAVWIHYEAFSRSQKITGLLTPFSMQAVFNTTLSVDTFFFVSGLLTSYIAWAATDGGQRSKFNSVAFLISRYIRLTPGLLFSILLVFILPSFSSGPLWRETVEPIVQGCRANWWVNLLYLQNYIDAEHICLLPSWWLANDMHLHIMSLLVIVLWMRSESLGQLSTALIIVGFSIAAAIDSYVHDYPPTILATHPQVQEVWTDLILRHFYRPYLHAGPFFGGLALGVMLSRGSRHQFPKLSKAKLYTGWTLTAVTMFLVLNGPYAWTIGQQWSRLGSALFCSTNRLFWTGCMAWIVWACSAGHGGVVDAFLSWSPIIPLARMTYMVYLTHMLLVWTYMGTRRQLSDASIYTGLYMFIPHWFLSYILGFFATLFFESPFLVIQKHLFKKAVKARMHEPLSTNNNNDNGKLQSDQNHQQLGLMPISLTHINHNGDGYTDVANDDDSSNEVKLTGFTSR